MKTISSLLLILLLLLPACLPGKKMMVHPAGKVPAGEPARMLYALPQTLLHIDIRIVREEFIPGPYAPWAAEFLGIQGVQSAAGIEFRLLDASIKNLKEPDPLHYYFLTGAVDQLDLSVLDQLIGKGLLIDPSLPPAPLSMFNQVGTNPQAALITDLSYKDHMADRTDTLYKTILEDSLLVRIPVLRKVKEIKSQEDMAREIAHLIHQLRKRRIKMSSADYPVLPQGEAMQSALNELRWTEDRYLTLFTGRHFSDTLSYAWSLLPSASTPEESELCRFSPGEGLLPAVAESGQPVILRIKPLSATAEIPSLSTGIPNTLYYRIPDLAQVELIAGPQTLQAGRWPVFQYGKLVPYPIRTLKSRH